MRYAIGAFILATTCLGAFSITTSGLGAARVAGAPSCTGTDASVAVPDAPHGLYVWNPYVVQGGKYEAELESSVIGKDPTLCGVSLVVDWSKVESQKNSFVWSGIAAQAKPYAKAGLTVNLLFAAGPERGPKNPVTPPWVTNSASRGGLGVPIVRCNGQPPAPDYIAPAFERAWENFIAAAVKEYSGNNSALAPHIGYMRFAIGFGVEAIPAHFDSGAHKDCLAKWQAAPVGFTYKKWVAHAVRIVDFMGSQSTDKQLLVALNHLAGGPSIYDYSNQVAKAAASGRVGIGTENLGIANVATADSKPAKCKPHAKITNLYWCQAFTRHAGRIPFEFQTIVASTAPEPGVSTIVLGKALEYGMANKAQIFELYPQEWLANDAAHKAALRTASRTLGAH